METVVKTLLKILLAGFAVFMLLAVAQEWEIFATAWFGERRSSAEATAADEEAAAETVRDMLALMRHLYQSGGDPRFAERMPISDGLRDEMMADIDYLSRNHRRQDPVLQQLEIEAVEPVGRDRIEVRTREFWQMKFLSLVSGEPSDEPRWQIVRGRYLAVRTARGWRVESWDFVDEESASGSGAA